MPQSLPRLSPGMPWPAAAYAFSYKRRKKDEKIASNIKAMQESISKHGMFHEESTNQGLWNFLDKFRHLLIKVSHDMFALRIIGQTAFETYVSSKRLQDASTQAPIRKKHLCTFSCSHTNRKTESK